MSVAEASSTKGNHKKEYIFNTNKDNFWHSEKDPIPYIALKMNGKEEVFMVKVIDRLGCKDCSGRFKDVEVRVSQKLSYDDGISCGIRSGDGIVEYVHK